VQPALTHIGLTWESKERVELIALLWTAGDGIISIQEVQENLPLPPPPKFRVKGRRMDKEDKDTGQERMG
jgi:hypothetical protein